MRKRRTAEEEVSLLDAKLDRRYELGAVDIRRVKYFLQHIDQKDCFMSVLQRIYLLLSKNYRARLNKNEVEILSLLGQQYGKLGFPE